MRSKLVGNKSHRWIRFLGVVIILVVLLSGFLKIYKNSIWDGDRRFTLVINSQPILLFSIEPISHQAIVLTFPENTLLDVPYGYKTYPASSIFRLGELDTTRGGGVLLTKSIENSFGITVEGYFSPNNRVDILPEIDKPLLQKFKSSYFSFWGSLISFRRIKEYLGNNRTNLSPIDLIHLWNAVRVLRSDQIQVINLDNAGVLELDKLSDGTIVKRLDKDRLEVILADNYQDQQVRLENISLEVVNATGREKLATQFAKILKSLGANVIIKSSSSNNEQAPCRIFMSESHLGQSNIVSRLIHLYQCKVSSDNIPYGQADIKVVLGEGFLK